MRNDKGSARNRLAAAYCLHDDCWFLGDSIRSVARTSKTPVFTFVGMTPWHGQPADWRVAENAATRCGASVVTGRWESELEQRSAAMTHLRDSGFQYALIPDGDEILEASLLEALEKVAGCGLADRVYVEWDTYWKTAEYVIRPRERFTPCILVNLDAAKPTGGRNFDGGRPLFLSAEHGIIHHLSYAGPDERILRKLETWGHANEVVPAWFERVWHGWDQDHTLRDLHPTHPAAYGFAERVPVPDILSEVQRRIAAPPDPPPPSTPSIPAISVVIPAHGQVENLRRCLAGLAECGDPISEILVVDNGSPEPLAPICATYNDVRTVSLENNEGFARACNAGFRQTTRDLVLFLNSDTAVPKAGLVRLAQSLLRSGTIAAAGPMSNHVGHGQQVFSTYTGLERLDLFAEDFAESEAEDEERDMLVGFCLLARRSALEEAAEHGQVFDERFGLGTFEDNDLCYRLRRAGYRLALSKRSFVHHEGSKTLSSVVPDVAGLLARNERLFREKWREDVESGFASGLSGLTADPIVFRADKHPDLRTRRLAEKARQADISLCMIVKNEERVFAAALESAAPFFREMIVVDTGSTDRTVEIATEAGAQVHSFPWTDSFAQARNESLRYATGRWIFWMDADDTLPHASGETLLDSVLNAPPGVTGFVVPVQFVDDGNEAGQRAAGTRVDHVKLFRNLPGLRFEGRIHEQILPSIRRVAPHGQIVRCGAIVLHSGYDSSAEGQKRKRVRDYKLLELDLSERPDHPFVLFCYGMTDHYCDKHDEAVMRLRRCIEVSTPDLTHLRKAYPLLAVSLRKLGRDAESLSVLEEGLRVVGEDPELRFHLGIHHAHVANYGEAKANYIRCAGADIGDHFSSVDMGILGYKAFHNLAGVCLELGEYGEAKEWWRKSMEAAPQFCPSAYSLFDAALDARDLPAAREALDHVQANEGASESWVKMGVRYAEAVGGEANVDAFLQSAVWQDPRPTPARLELARRLLAQERVDEAEPHLRALNEMGVPEAAYCLGVMHIRRGDLAAALVWMERALALNPSHVETFEQVERLRKALTANPVSHDRESGRSSATAEPLSQALGRIARVLELDAQTLVEFAEEDGVGGYGCPVGKWPGGSVWEEEGKALYAMVRALKPEIIVEVGSLVGCSTSHLAAACRANGGGRVYAVDPTADLSGIDPELMECIVPVAEDVFSWEPPQGMGFVFEDGSHAPGFTRAVIERLAPKLTSGALVCCHDFYTEQLPYVQQEFAFAMKALGADVAGCLIGPSDCGIGIAKLPKGG